METEIKTFVDGFQALGMVGILTILAIPVLRRKLGFNDKDEMIEEHEVKIADLEKHAVVANSEMGDVKEQLKDHGHVLGEIREDVAYIRGKVN